MSALFARKASDADAHISIHGVRRSNDHPLPRRVFPGRTSWRPTMRKLLTFLKPQNPRRGGQGPAGGWFEASSWTRCQPKDPRNRSATTSYLQARSLSIALVLYTTRAVFAVGAPAVAQVSMTGAGRRTPAPPSGPTTIFTPNPALSDNESGLGGNSLRTVVTITGGRLGRVRATSLAEVHRSWLPMLLLVFGREATRTPRRRRLN
jgi:hypothetical protein